VVHLFLLSTLPRRHRLRIGPQAFPLLSRVLLQPFENDIPWRILPIPPAPAVLDQLLIEAHPIGQNHILDGALVLVEAVSLEGYVFAEGEVIDSLFGFLDIGSGLRPRRRQFEVWGRSYPPTLWAMDGSHRGGSAIIPAGAKTRLVVGSANVAEHLCFLLVHTLPLSREP
jgi:hypothetical protein